ncbi:hypothetical protein ACFWMX_36110 [Streptomyces sp. NPDC058378]|uniref:hypothetical protein n=1 Tax=unclassified Streptomyces TaxID=2593676 RepID=UPI00364D7469
MGDTVGVTQVRDLVTAGQEGTPPRFCTGREGEALYNGAVRAYDAPDVERLLAANRPVVTRQG